MLLPFIGYICALLPARGVYAKKFQPSRNNAECKGKKHRVILFFSLTMLHIYNIVNVLVIGFETYTSKEKKEVENMKFIIDYKDEAGKPDRVEILAKKPFEFEDGVKTAENIIEAIELFETITCEYWGTDETRDDIFIIQVLKNDRAEILADQIREDPDNMEAGEEFCKLAGMEEDWECGGQDKITRRKILKRAGKRLDIYFNSLINK